MYIRMYDRTMYYVHTYVWQDYTYETVLCAICTYVQTSTVHTYVRAQHMTVSSLQAHCTHPHEQSMAVVDGVPQLKGKHGVRSSLAELVPQLVGCQPVPV